MRVILMVLTTLLTCITAKKVEKLTSIYGMQGIRVMSDTKSKLELVRSFESDPDFDFLKLTRDLNFPVEVLVPADKLKHFKSHLDANQIKYEVVIEDMSKVIKDQLDHQKRRRFKRGVIPADILDYFPRYDEIKTYLKYLAKAYDKQVKGISIGKTFEGRDIVAVKISSGGENKSSIIIDAGIHAREWITPITALHIIRQLVENATNSYIYQNVDIYIIPVLNPDGYEFSHVDEDTRFWRKTRSFHGDVDCIGVDANRNFAYQWKAARESDSTCSPTYPGSGPFSESETSALKGFILSRENVKVYISFHSAASAFFYPWAFNTFPPENVNQLRCVAEKAEAALSKVRGTRFRVGTPARLIYPIGGTSMDWALGAGNVELAYSIELPGRPFNFEAPPSEIKPIGQEAFEAFKVIAKYAEVGDCEKL